MTKIEVHPFQADRSASVSLTRLHR